MTASARGKACDIIEPRWTLLILCELSHGATRSKRLKEMEYHGLVRRVESDAVIWATHDPHD
jgi:DNA-binding HxlR family transcriptional regulator